MPAQTLPRNADLKQILQNARTWLAVPALVLSTLVVSVFFGLLFGTGRTTIGILLLGAIGGLIVFLLFNSRFTFGVLVLPVMAMAVPIELPTGTHSRLPASLVLAILLCGLWATRMVLQRSLSLKPSLVNVPGLTFCSIMIISFLWGLAWRDPILNPIPNFEIVQIASLVTLIVSFGATLLVGNFIQTEAHLKFIFWAFAVIGGLMHVTRFLDLFPHLLNHGGLAGLWTGLIAFCVLISYHRVAWYWKLLLLGSLILNLYVNMVINVAWLSGWLPTVAGILIAAWLHSKRLAIAFVIAIVLFALLNGDLIDSLIADEMSGGSDQRMSLWELNWQVFSAHWIFGTGPAGYVPYYMTYWPQDARSTHNNYMDIISQFGLSGTLTWFWFAICGIWEGLRLLGRVSRKHEPFLYVLTLTATSGWIAAQASMLLGDWILPFAYNQTIAGYKYTVYSWIFLGTLISVRTILSRRAMQENAETPEL